MKFSLIYLCIILTLFSIINKVISKRWEILLSSPIDCFDYSFENQCEASFNETKLNDTELLLYKIDLINQCNHELFFISSKFKLLTQLRLT